MTLNSLSYDTIFLREKCRKQTVSHFAKTHRRVLKRVASRGKFEWGMVGGEGLEPPTFSV